MVAYVVAMFTIFLVAIPSGGSGIGKRDFGSGLGKVLIFGALGYVICYHVWRRHRAGRSRQGPPAG